MVRTFLLTAWLACCGFVSVSLAAQAPNGFTPLFNGKDLTGWRGGTTYDPRRLGELPAAEREALITKWTASLTELKDGKPHWRAEDGVLVNDGFGGYATTQKEFGDF